jgi:protein TonB
MFEDSTFESAGKIHTRSRRWGIAAFLFNGAILAALVIIPLIYPEALPSIMTTMVLTVPEAPQAQPKPLPQQPTQAFHGQKQFDGINLSVPTQIPTTIRKFERMEALPPGSDVAGIDLGPNHNGIPGADDPFGHSSNQPRVVAEHKGPVVISQGVAEGMLLQKVTPHYPPIAVASRTQGTVMLQAMISKSGTIENLRVESGSPMLIQAAIDAVSQWRYRPYLLNGQPVEVETTVRVVFTLNQ